MAVPQPPSQANERAYVGTDDGLDALEPRQGQRRKQRKEDVDKGGETSMPAADAADARGSSLGSGERAGGRAGARQECGLDLGQRRVSVRTDVVWQQAMVVIAGGADENEHPRRLGV